MKCADCKFWREVDPGDGGLPAMGECHRNAPRPAFDDVVGAAQRVRRHEGFKADAEWEPMTSDWWARTVAWPATPASDFCGEFQAARSASFV